MPRAQTRGHYYGGAARSVAPAASPQRALCASVQPKEKNQTRRREYHRNVPAYRTETQNANKPTNHQYIMSDPTVPTRRNRESASRRDSLIEEMQRVKRRKKYARSITAVTGKCAVLLHTAQAYIRRRTRYKKAGRQVIYTREECALACCQPRALCACLRAILQRVWRSPAEEEEQAKAAAYAPRAHAR